MPFADFLGNQHCVTVLQRAIEQGRIPQAVHQRVLAHVMPLLA
jgi:DNA polymerase III gamma/tau subunit